MMTVTLESSYSGTNVTTSWKEYCEQIIQLAVTKCHPNDRSTGHYLACVIDEVLRDERYEYILHGIYHDPLAEVYRFHCRKKSPKINK